MRGSQAWVSLVALAVVVSVATAAQPNDAGTGVDAGNVMDQALELTGFGTYAGSLADSAGVDWFAWKLANRITTEMCESVDVTAEFDHGTRLIGVDGNMTREVDAQVPANRTARIGLALPSFEGGLIELDRGALPAIPGYTFTSLSHTGGLHDGGTGADAPSTTTGALSLGACTLGKVTPSAGDSVDVYKFTVSANDKVTVSIADASGVVTGQVLDGSSNVLANVGANALSTLTLTTAGTYYLSMTSSSTSTYAIGLCEPNCGPPSAPCHPMCITVIENL